MDPVSAIGLVGSLVGISDIIAKSLRRLIDLQSRYRSASLVVSLLIGQLTTLKAAVNQITEWVGSSLLNKPKNEQVVADLKTSSESCKLLILVLEERISQLERDDISGNLNVKGKIGFLWEESDLKEFSNHLNNQANALNLLLTALHCRTAFERNALLQDDKSRRIIKRVEDDRVSLLSLRDSASEITQRSRVTESSALLDVEFDFDQEVVTTSVYRAALRSNLQKAAIRKGKLPELASTIQGFNPIPEDEEVPERLIDNPHESESDSSHTVLPSEAAAFPSLEAPSEFPIFLPADGVILQTTEVSQTSTRLGSASRLSDDVSTRSSKSQEESDEGVPGQAVPLPRPLLASQNKVRDKQRDSKGIKSRINVSRIRKLFTTHNSVDAPEFPIPHEAPDLDSQTPVQEGPPSVIVLGAGNSGKSSLIKSMDVLCYGDWTTEDRLYFQDTIFTNTVQNMKDILAAMDALGILPDTSTDPNYAHTIMSQPSVIGAGVLPPDVCEAIEALWQDSGVRSTFTRSNEYMLQDAAAYFFDSVRRISEPGYIPSDEDIIRARTRSTGLYKTTLRFDSITFKLTDTAGDRSERKKWLHVFEKASIVIFVADISAYDLGLNEDIMVSRLLEDLVLFESIANSRWFTNSRIILLFTKMDILEAKIKKVPFEEYFPDFTGNGRSLEDVKSYMERRFLSLATADPGRIIRTIYSSFVNEFNGLEESAATARSLLNAITHQLSDSPELNGITA